MVELRASLSLPTRRLENHVALDLSHTVTMILLTRSVVCSFVHVIATFESNSVESSTVSLCLINVFCNILNQYFLFILFDPLVMCNVINNNNNNDICQ